ncbi:MAG: hypothetical protein HKN86_05645 [Acidimicrobiia bacterium]|nr:hypothetical protein [Acidimicrobiia bacterium]
MKGQKQSRIDNVEKRISAMTNVLQAVISEIENLKTMVFGQQELIKQFKEYEKAIELLKEKAAESDGETKKVVTDRENS